MDIMIIKMKHSKNNISHEVIKGKAKELFYRYGLKSVVVSDIANSLAVSKKTIYQFFRDKNAIVGEVVEDLLRLHEQLLKTSIATSNDAIDEVLKHEAGLAQIWQSLRPNLFLQLEKYYPESWEKVEQYITQMQYEIVANLLRGKEEGLYREDIHILLLSDLRLHQVLNILQPERLTSKNLHFVQLAEECTALYLRSIATEKGHRLIDQYLNRKQLGNTTDNKKTHYS
jgi:AcrR family transcriptional regulator